jgi:hypothetical protein
VTNLDNQPLPEVDVVHDLNVTPWPFEAGEFSRVIASGFPSGVDMDTVAAESFRVLQSGGRLNLGSYTLQFNAAPFTKAGFTDVKIGQGNLSVSGTRP